MTAIHYGTPNTGGTCDSPECWCHIFHRNTAPDPPKPEVKVTVTVQGAIRELPAQEPRVESGPIQFGTDWPGVFIRGDSAAWTAMLLKTLLESGKVDDLIIRWELQNLQQLLSACVIGYCRTMVAMDEQKPSVRELAIANGVDLSRIKDQQDAIDVLTGKRATME